MTSYARFPNPPAVGHVTETQLPVNLPIGQLRSGQAPEAPPPMGPAGVSGPSLASSGEPLHYMAVRGNMGRLGHAASLVAEAYVVGRGVVQGEHAYEKEHVPEHAISSVYPRKLPSDPSGSLHAPRREDFAAIRPLSAGHDLPEWDRPPATLPSAEEMAASGIRVPRTMRAVAAADEWMGNRAAGQPGGVRSMINTAQKYKVFGR